jgi:predicted Zn finger-like uncharacterized protein
VENMRLVCPNCASQYEVSDSAIPESGRDVQCASCSHVWFQDAVLMLQPNEMLETKPISAGQETNSPKPDHDLTDLSKNISAEFRSQRGEQNTDSDSLDQEVTSDPIESPVARPVNEAVKDILRSEAEFSSSRVSAPVETTIPDEPPVTSTPEETTTASEPQVTTRFADILAQEVNDANVEDEVETSPIPEIEENDDTSSSTPLRRIRDAVEATDAVRNEPPMVENVSPLRRILSDPEDTIQTPAANMPAEPEPKVEESKTGAELQLLRQRIFDLEKSADEPATPIVEPDRHAPTEPEAEVPKDLNVSATETPSDVESELDYTETGFGQAIRNDRTQDNSERTALSSNDYLSDTDVSDGVKSELDDVSETKIQPAPTGADTEEDNILDASEGLLSVAALRAERETRAREKQFNDGRVVETSTQPVVTEETRIEPEVEAVPLRSAKITPVVDDEPVQVKVRKFGDEVPAAADASPKDSDEQLPDVDELNTSLRMDEKNPLQEMDIDADEPKARSFYMRGILTAILIFLLVALLYLLAKPLAQMFPVLEPVLGFLTGSVEQGFDAAGNTAEKNSGTFGWISGNWDKTVAWLESF